MTTNPLRQSQQNVNFETNQQPHQQLAESNNQDEEDFDFNRSNKEDGDLNPFEQADG